MPLRQLFILMLALLLVAAPLSAQESTPQSTQFHMVGYFTSWAIYARHYFVTDIPADKLTDLNYAFAGISDDGQIAMLDPWADKQFPYPNDADNQALKGNFHQLQLLKQAHPNLHILISVGGWTESAKFSDVALTDASRAKFAASVVQFVTQYGFDGVDIDWEYPTGGGNTGNIERPQDKDNFVLLLAALRTHLDAQGAQDGHHYLLTIALGSDKSAYGPLDWTKITPLLDWINVMTYDMSGSWSDATGFNAPLYDPAHQLSADTTLQGLLAFGLPPDKLVMGVPFYGRGWSGVAVQNNGLHQPFTSIPQGTWEAGAFDYNDLAAHYVGKYQRFWDDTAQVPWLYDPASGTMITYDDPESLGKKAEYVQANGLGGVMFWELSGDTADHALVDALYTGLHGE